MAKPSCCAALLCVQLLWLSLLVNSQTNDGAVFQCNFDLDLCGCEQTGSEEWQRRSGSTSTILTGPDGDYPFGDGLYLYQETSFNSPGSTVALLLPETDPDRVRCLSLWYHMYGESVGTLEVKVNGTWTLWQKSKEGDRGVQAWRQALVDIPAASTTIIIKATRLGAEPYGDVAIDDVTLHLGQCTDLPPYVMPTTTTTQNPNTTPSSTVNLPVFNGTVYECTFEEFSNCTVDQDESVEATWELTSGGTSTPLTGPDSGVDGAGDSYLYFEASGVPPGATAVITFSDLPSPGLLCLFFAYHMYGRHVGSLEVKVTKAGGAEEVVWSRQLQGDRGVNEWQAASVPLSPGTQSYSFIATKGGSSPADVYGDIAIDALRLGAGNCSQLQFTTSSPDSDVTTATPRNSDTTSASNSGATRSTSPGSTTSTPSIDNTTSTSNSQDSPSTSESNNSTFMPRTVDITSSSFIEDITSPSVNEDTTLSSEHLDTTSTFSPTSFQATSAVTSNIPLSSNNPGESEASGKSGQSSENGLSSGSVAGISVSVILIFFIVLVLIIWGTRRRRNKTPSEDSLSISSGSTATNFTLPKSRAGKMSWRKSPGVAYTSTSEFHQNWAYQDEDGDDISVQSVHDFMRRYRKKGEGIREEADC